MLVVQNIFIYVAALVFSIDSDRSLFKKSIRTMESLLAHDIKHRGNMDKLMASMKEKLDHLIVQLFEIEAVKFGEFKLKSGIKSPVYFDLRVIISFPKILEEVSEIMWTLVDQSRLDVICGVPYTALPIATCMSVSKNVPMVIRRKEMKDYGTRKMVEGRFQPDARCLIVEDVVTTGSSVLETEEVLRKEGLKVEDAIVLVDREQGGRRSLEEKRIKMASVFTLRQLLRTLVEKGLVDQEMETRVGAFLAEQNSVQCPAPVKPLALSQRQQKSSNEIGRRLYSLIMEKKTNLCVAVDETSTARLLSIANDVGPHICILKTHADLVVDFTADTGKQLKELSTKHNFLIFEDRKFSDIGQTVYHQALSGPGRILEWADIVNAHSLPGPGVVQGLREAVEASGRQVACLLVAEMSSAGSLFTADYTASTAAMATAHADFVIGFISQGRVSGASDVMISCTPGVKIGGGGDVRGQQYSGPEAAILDRGSDVIIVGRGVTREENKVDAAQRYREAAFNALLQREESLQ